MSEDMSRAPGSTRAYEAFAVEPVDGAPRRFDNPLVKGLLVLLMLAIATTVLVATDDDDDRTVVAGPAIASEPLEPATPSSVQQVASETAQADPDPEPAAAEAWTAGLSALTVERNRQEALATTTTAAPTTTAPPTTAPPTTVAPTTAPPTTAAASTEADQADADATESTDATTTEATDADTTTETTTATTTEAPTTTAAPTTESTANPDGWVDAGHGVLVPQVLLAIRWCESRDDYQAANPASSARGAYQFLTGSWEAYGHAERYGVSRAHLASNAQQDEAALLTWQRDGTRPWNASKHCWQSRV